MSPARRITRRRRSENRREAFSSKQYQYRETPMLLEVGVHIALTIQH
jgi:hypothetical protein